MSQFKSLSSCRSRCTCEHSSNILKFYYRGEKLYAKGNKYILLINYIVHSDILLKLCLFWGIWHFSILLYLIKYRFPFNMNNTAKPRACNSCCPFPDNTWSAKGFNWVRDLVSRSNAEFCVYRKQEILRFIRANCIPWEYLYLKFFRNFILLNIAYIAIFSRLSVYNLQLSIIFQVHNIYLHNVNRLRS